MTFSKTRTKSKVRARAARAPMSPSRQAMPKTQTTTRAAGRPLSMSSSSSSPAGNACAQSRRTAAARTPNGQTSSELPRGLFGGVGVLQKAKRRGLPSASEPSCGWEKRSPASFCLSTLGLSSSPLDLLSFPLLGARRRRRRLPGREDPRTSMTTQRSLECFPQSDFRTWLNFMLVEFFSLWTVRQLMIIQKSHAPLANQLKDEYLSVPSSMTQVSTNRLLEGRSAVLRLRDVSLLLKRSATLREPDYGPQSITRYRSTDDRLVASQLTGDQSLASSLLKRRSRRVCV